MTHLQRRRYMKRNTSMRTPHGKTPSPKQTATRQAKKNPCFPLFFGHPGRVGTHFEDNFSAANETKNKKKKNGPENENPKIGKRYFSPDFLRAPKARVNKRSGGGRFF